MSNSQSESPTNSIRRAAGRGCAHIVCVARPQFGSNEYFFPANSVLLCQTGCQWPLGLVAAQHSKVSTNANTATYTVQ